MSYLFTVFLLSLFCLLSRTISVNHVTLLMGFPSSFHTCQNPHIICNLPWFLCALICLFNMSHASCLCVVSARTFLILLPSLMVMWWMKNVDCFYLGRRVEEKHGSKGISWDSNFSLLYLRTPSWRTTSLCSFLQATNWAWKRLIYHINVNILWVLPVLCSLSKLLSSVYLPVENCFVVHLPVFWFSSVGLLLSLCSPVSHSHFFEVLLLLLLFTCVDNL